MLPLLLCGVLVILDIGWLVVDQCRLNDAARAGARSIIVEHSDTGDTARQLVHHLVGDTARVDVDESDGLATVRVSRAHEFVTPLVNLVFPSVLLHASSTMLVEPRNRILGD